MELENQKTRKQARTAGLLYLLVFIGAGFTEGFVRSGAFVPGDATATAQNILASPRIFRLGLASDLIAFLADAAIAILLYVLLKPAGRVMAMMAAAFRLIAHPAIGSLNLLNHAMAIGVLDGNPAAFENSAEMSYLFLEAHSLGYLIGGAFFGVHLALLGWLMLRSNSFPKWLAVLLMLAAAGYLVETFGTFSLPSYGDTFTLFVVILAVPAELCLSLWLMFTKSFSRSMRLA